MNPMFRATLRGAAAVMFGFMTLAASHAQGFPSKPVTLVNPYPPGGGADLVARAIAKELTEQWKQPVLVESKPGAGTTIAAAFVARAPADGYTLLLSTTQHAIAPSLFKTLSYDYLTAFAPIAVLSDSPFFLVVRPDRGINNVGELLAQLKQKGSTMNFGSSGPGSLPHLSGALMNQLTGASATHVPYPGTAPALTSLIGGQIDYLFADTSALSNIQGGKAKALAVTSASRFGGLPGVPALSESLPGFQLTVWTALEAPAGTPRPVIDRIHEGVMNALKSPAIQKMFAENARTIVTFTPEQFAAFKTAEVKKYQKLAHDAGLKLE